MSDKEKHIEMLEGKIPTLSASAFAAAREEVLASGHSVVESDNGFLYKVFPNGSRVPLKEIPAPTPVVSGSVMAIR
jgi:hypothetical protein